jgi:uncharacterized protein (DUF934 family)
VGAEDGKGFTSAQLLRAEQHVLNEKLHSLGYQSAPEG